MGSRKADKTQLSPREKQIQQLYNSGLSRNEIAAQLGIAYCTVLIHLKSIRDRSMGAGNMTHTHHYLDSQAIEESKSMQIVKGSNVTEDTKGDDNA